MYVSASDLAVAIKLFLFVTSAVIAESVYPSEVDIASDLAVEIALFLDNTSDVIAASVYVSDVVIA